MTTLTLEIPIDTDRSSKVISAEVWIRPISAGISSFTAVLNNQDGSLNSAFSPQNTVEIAVTGKGIPSSEVFFRGYVDDPESSVYDRADIFEHYMRVSGRGYGQDLMNLYITKSYAYNTRIDDLIEDALSTAGSEINYTSGSSESQIAGGYEAKRDYLINIFRDCLEREFYDAYVDEDKNLDLIDLSDPPDSGITLKSVAGASDNNIIAIKPIQYIRGRGLNIRNYVEVVGPRVRDGWTDGNASDWTGGTNTAVTNETTLVKVGNSSILGTFTFDGANSPHLYLDFSGGLYSKTDNYLDWSIYGQEEIMWWGRVHRTAAVAPIMCRARLKDTDGNIIDYINGKFEAAIQPDTWYSLGAPIGTECEIKAAETDDYWHYINGAAFNWEIERLGFWSDTVGVAEAYQDKIYIDDLRAPEEMVSISENAASQASYRKRQIVFYRPYIATQLELDDLSAKYLAILKDPLKSLTVQAAGTAGIIETDPGPPPVYTNMWRPGYKLNVNIPALGISSEYWSIASIHHIVAPRQDLGHGQDFITEVELMELSAKWKQNITDIEGTVDERIRSLERKGTITHSEFTGYYWSKQP